MIGLVIVSHSAKLAEGVRELAVQMVKDRVPIAVAAGIDDPSDPIGTDPMRVVAAIEAVYSTDGVLVLMDLGSALMSAEMALEFLTPEQQAHIFLCEAPLVEGAIAAAVQAMTGSSITEVINEARNALAAKAQQLAPFLPPVATQPAPDMLTTPGADIGVTKPRADLGGAQTLKINVTNPRGLHARPLARLIGLLGQFAAEVSVTNAGQTVNGRSMNKVATLGTKQGDTLIFQASGIDATAALAAIQTLAADNFGERQDIAPFTGPSTMAREAKRPVLDISTEAREIVLGRELVGIPAAPGIAIGRVAFYRPTLPTVVEQMVDDGAAEWLRFQSALQAALAELQQMEAQTQQTAGATEAEIFAAQRLLLQDPEIQADVQRQILAERRNAEAAWQRAMQAVGANYRALDNVYLRERATDVFDIGARVLRHLLQIQTPTLVFDESVILVADELTPSDIAQLNPDQVLGLVTALGGVTSHSVILARALGIPAIVGVGPNLYQLSDGQMIALDGSCGHIWLTPDAEQVAAFQRQRAAWQAEQQAVRQAGQSPASTRDGKRVEVGANISNPTDVARALAVGAEGVGLFRTEFLFMARTQPPSEEEQLAVYRAAAQALAGRSLIIRTLDIGGDKPLAYLGLPIEANPEMGWRGLRYCLAHPPLFKAQLRASLRASADYPIKIMFPMVSTVDEVRQAKVILGQAQTELRDAGVKFDQKLEIGTMIEVPAAVLTADQLAQEVDFFSLGTNDLTQYIMAADRGNSQVAKLVNALQPAVIRAIQQVVNAAHAAGIWVGLCGELAGNTLATPLLVGLGLDELSMSAPAIPQVKARIRQLDIAQAQQVAAACLALSSAEEIEKLLTEVSLTNV